MALSEQKKLSLSQNNISNLSAPDTNELTINEDSDNNYDSEDFEEAYNDLFSDGTESDIEFEGSLQKMMKDQQMMTWPHQMMKKLL